MNNGKITDSISKRGGEMYLEVSILTIGKAREEWDYPWREHEQS